MHNFTTSSSGCTDAGASYSRTDKQSSSASTTHTESIKSFALTASSDSPKPMMIISFTWAVANLTHAAACTVRMHQIILPHMPRKMERASIAEPSLPCMDVIAIATSTKASICFVSFVICCTTDFFVSQIARAASEGPLEWHVKGTEEGQVSLSNEAFSSLTAGFETCAHNFYFSPPHYVRALADQASLLRKTLLERFAGRHGR